MRCRSVLTSFLAAICLVALLAGAPGSSRRAQAQVVTPGREALPAGVVVETVLSDMNNPVAMTFDPAGRLFYTEKNTGSVRLFANGALQPNPVITFQVDTERERGLIGIAVDPNFNQNRYIYVYYTCLVGPDCASLENRVARFVENNGAGSNPTIIFTSSQSADRHTGGNIHFGPDGKLYITIGDDANPANAQDVADKHGKIHRINPDGSMPSDNPIFAQAGALPSLYAMGFRNSFDFTFDPVVPGRIFASENGPGCDDEMNRVEAGYNYGWRADYPCFGDNLNSEYNTIPPLWSNGGLCCAAPTGIVVYTGDEIPEWRNHLFMASYEPPRRLYHFYLNDDRTAITAVNVLPDVFANMDVANGPDGALWFINGGGYTPGTLQRLVRSTVAATATPQTAQTPQPLVTPTQPTAAPAIPGSSSRAFPETGKTVSGIFLDYWDSHSGLPQQGFPISDLMSEVSDLDGKSYTVQYFERAVFEYHPENAAPYDILLSQLGTFQYKEKYPNGAPNQQPDTTEGSQLFPETGKRVGGKFLVYWQEQGGLAQQGFPISDEFSEVSDLDGKEYLVQYFERAVFELHPENAGTPYEVLLSQLGTVQYKEKYGSP